MTPTHFSIFKALHENETPLLLNNIWDAAGAVLAETNGAAAIATSSASLAWSCGYADGSLLPQADLLINVRRIKRVTHLPLSIDIEDGYSSSPQEVASLVLKLAELGIAGINIEDGKQSPALLIKKITAIRKAVGNEIFINARTDTYLQKLVAQEHVLDESIKRINEYDNAGANSAFVSGTLDNSALNAIAQRTHVPLNAMIPSIDYGIRSLVAAGVKRFSTGPSPFLSAYSHLMGQRESLSFEKINNLL